jgi:two-component system cell cycle sensor histidine kinase/response regulator CckA
MAADFIGRGRVLVVDDDEAMRAFLEEELRDEGFQVTGAPDTLSALIHLLGKVVDVLVVDWKMPTQDGFYLLSTVRRSHPKLPVIFVTAYARPEIQRRALECGAFGFLAKPFPLGGLVREIEEALRSRARAGKAEPDDPATSS